MIRKTRKTDNIKECFPKDGFCASYQLLIMTQIRLRPNSSSKNRQIHQQKEKQQINGTQTSKAYLEPSQTSTMMEILQYSKLPYTPRKPFKDNLRSGEVRILFWISTSYFQIKLNL